MAVLGPAGTKISPLTREPLGTHVLPNRTLLRHIQSYDEEMMRAAEVASAAAVKAERERRRAAGACEGPVRALSFSLGPPAGS